MTSVALQWFAEGLGAMFDQVADLVYDNGTDGQPGYVPGYGALLDPTLCAPENLPYLGQYVGVQIPIGTDPATALSLIMAEAGQHRGTLGAVIAAVKRYLTGSQYYAIQERLGPDGATADAYWLNIEVRTSELTDLTGLTNAVNAVLPGGVFVTITASNQPTWAGATLTWATVGSTVTWANAAIGGV